jgi:hypothetical protein
MPFLFSTQSDAVEMFKFEVPSLMVGTLDRLMVSDFKTLIFLFSVVHFMM